MAYGECTLQISNKSKTIKESHEKVNDLNIKEVELTVTTDKGLKYKIKVHDFNFLWYDEN